MSRLPGDRTLSVTYDISKKAPLDAKMLVSSFSDLTNPDTWKVDSPSGTSLVDSAYQGMIVSVSNDPNTLLNGVYRLKKLDQRNYLVDIADPDNWELLGSGANLDNKVDKEPGKGLSDENYTSAEKSKLAGLEGSKYKGTYTSLSALVSAIADPVAGDYADVDEGVGIPTKRYIWDTTDSGWVAPSGDSTELTAAQIKTMYEDNPDTNAYTDTEKNKLGSIATGATKNSTDAALRDRTRHTGKQPISSVEGLQNELNKKIEQSSLDAVPTIKGTWKPSATGIPALAKMQKADAFFMEMFDELIDKVVFTDNSVSTSENGEGGMAIASTPFNISSST